MKFAGYVLIPLLLSGFASSVMATDEVQVTAAAASSAKIVTTKFAPMSNPFFAQAIALRGKLGDARVLMHLQPKTEDSDSVEGSYLLSGSQRNKANKAIRILLAGEVSGNKLSMEESEDGVDVSGQWDGELSGKTIRGVWQSDDGKVTKDFVLKLIENKAGHKNKK